MVIKIFINIKLDSLCDGSYKVHADVTFILWLVHHLHTYRCQQLEPHQTGHLTVYVGGGVDLRSEDVFYQFCLQIIAHLFLHNIVEDRQ